MEDIKDTNKFSKSQKIMQWAFGIGAGTLAGFGFIAGMPIDSLGGAIATTSQGVAGLLATSTLASGIGLATGFISKKIVEKVNEYNNDEKSKKAKEITKEKVNEPIKKENIRDELQKNVKEVSIEDKHKRFEENQKQIESLYKEDDNKSI